MNGEMGERSYRDMIVSGHAPIAKVFTIESGADITEGQVLAKKANGKLVAYDSDGSSPLNVAYAVAPEDIDATGGDVDRSVYIAGVFRKESIVFANSTDTVSDVFDDLRTRGVILI
jgi:hypothetical protein